MPKNHPSNDADGAKTWVNLLSVAAAVVSAMAGSAASFVLVLLLPMMPLEALGGAGLVGAVFAATLCGYGALWCEVFSGAERAGLLRFAGFTALLPWIVVGVFWLAAG